SLLSRTTSILLRGLSSGVIPNTISSGFVIDWTRYRRKMEANTYFNSTIAYRCPMQLRGPALKGMKAYVGILWDSWSRNLSGMNSFGFGKYCTARWRYIIGI